MRIKILINHALLLSLLFLVGACQHRPTKMYESSEVKARNQNLAELFKGELIVDARPAFDFNLSKINGSINIRWEEFTQKDEDLRGVFERDLYFHSRRLARMGINPDTPITVVGRGPLGAGEEGRVAWTLKYLGIKNVRFIHIDAYERGLNSQASPPPRAPVAIWKPSLDESLIISKNDFLKKTMVPRDNEQGVVILDVRPVQEYLGKLPSPLKIRPPDLSAMNVPWTDFVTSYGLPNESIGEKLRSVGVTSNKEILVVSNFGIESATVVMVLRELGFSKSRNLAGGYSELIFNGKANN